MNLESQLQGFYKEWHRLAETEGEAIRSQNWTLVADCQKAIQHLQPLISRLTQEVREPSKRLEADRPINERSMREAITELIQIESRNSTLLQSIQQDAQAHASELEGAGRMLRQVQRLYSPSRPAAWTSFS